MESQYLKALKKNSIVPNFWCSQEYFEKAGWREVVSDGFIEVRDSEGFLMLPVLSENGYPLTTTNEDIWSDFPGWVNYNADKEFLDYEYLFDPVQFLSMNGGSWSVFRKNSRKWANRIGMRWEYKDLPKGYDSPQLESVLVDWLGGLDGEESVYGSDTLLEYLHRGDFRKGLFTEDGTLHAVNIWDFNWKYINYRYCICRNEPFLSEFARLLFYQGIYRECGTCVVNDGGVLDRVSLKDFKDKMNPISIRKVYSWRVK